MYYQRFAVEGTANATELDDGLVSLVEEKRHIRAILITCSDWENNVIEGWIGTERIMTLADYLIATEALEATYPKSTTQMVRFPVDQEIPAGQIFKIGIRCGATETDIFGAYEYDKVS